MRSVLKFENSFFNFTITKEAFFFTAFLPSLLSIHPSPASFQTISMCLRAWLISSISRASKAEASATVTAFAAFASPPSAENARSNLSSSERKRSTRASSTWIAEGSGGEEEEAVGVLLLLLPSFSFSSPSSSFFSFLPRTRPAIPKKPPRSLSRALFFAEATARSAIFVEGPT